jgi:hypothetical protein
MMLTTAIRVTSTYRTSSVVTVPIPCLYIAVVVVIFPSVRNCHYSLRNIPEESSYHLVGGGGGLLASQQRLLSSS